MRLIHSILTLFACQLGGAQITRLRADLLEGRDRSMRPVNDGENKTTILLGFSIKNFNVADYRSSIGINAWMVVIWEDEYLAWDPSEYDNLDNIHFQREEIWTPDISLLNGFDDDPSLGKVSVLVFSNGKVVWIPPFTGEVSCPMDLLKWPSDVHNCTLIFGSWTYQHEFIDVLPLYSNGTSYLMESYEENLLWKILNISSERAIFDHEGEDRSVIKLSVSLRRETGSYVGSLLNTSIALLFVVFSSYVLPLRFHLHRILFHLVSLKMLIACYLVLCFSLPPVGSTVPLVVVYYSQILILTSTSFLLTIVLASCLSSSLIKLHLRHAGLRCQLARIPGLKHFVSFEVPHVGKEEESIPDVGKINLSDLAPETTFFFRILNFSFGLVFLITSVSIMITLNSNYTS